MYRFLLYQSSKAQYLHKGWLPICAHAFICDLSQGAAALIAPTARGAPVAQGLCHLLSAPLTVKPDSKASLYKQSSTQQQGRWIWESISEYTGRVQLRQPRTKEASQANRVQCRAAM